NININQPKNNTKNEIYGIIGTIYPKNNPSINSKKNNGERAFNTALITFIANTPTVASFDNNPTPICFNLPNQPLLLEADPLPSTLLIILSKPLNIALTT